MFRGFDVAGRTRDINTGLWPASGTILTAILEHSCFDVSYALSEAHLRRWFAASLSSPRPIALSSYARHRALSPSRQLSPIAPL